MNFVKLHRGSRETLVNLDNVADIYTGSDGVGCNIHFSESDYIKVDETLEQIQNLIVCGEEMNEINDETNLTINLMKGKDEVKPLTEDELKASGWWCGDTSEECRLVFDGKGIYAQNDDWTVYKSKYKFCFMTGKVVGRSHSNKNKSLSEIYRIGNEFYWSEK